MTKCPEPEFQRKVLTKGTFFWIIGGIVLIALGIAALVYDAYSGGIRDRQTALEQRIETQKESNAYIYTPRAEHEMLKGDVGIMRNDIDHIKETTDKIWGFLEENHE